MSAEKFEQLRDLARRHQSTSVTPPWSVESHVTELADFALLVSREIPVDMILHCPSCGMQHIDAPEPDICECGHDEEIHVYRDGYLVLENRCRHRADPNSMEPPCECKCFKIAWNNPPHRSHLCAGCKTVWRPADVATNGVEKIETRGKADTWPG